MRRAVLVALSCASALTTLAAASGCASSAQDHDAGSAVSVPVCASSGPDPVLGPQDTWYYCAINVDNKAGSLRAYTIDLRCQTDSRGNFDAGQSLYYVPAGKHMISSTGILTPVTDQTMTCHSGAVTVGNLTSGDAGAAPAPSPTGSLADAVAALGPGGTPTPEDTAAEASAAAAAASASAAAAASDSAAAAASASASAALAAVQAKALARTYTVGHFSTTFTAPNPDIVELLAQVTSNDPDSGMAKKFVLNVTLLNADGSVDGSGVLCDWSLGAGDTHQEDFAPQGAADTWTSIRVTQGPDSAC